MSTTQNQQILKHLQDGNSITPIDALNLFDCFRLGARIYDLKAQGFNIHTELIHNGRKKFAKYTLLAKAK